MSPAAGNTLRIFSFLACGVPGWLRELMREPVASFRGQLVQPNRACPERAAGPWPCYDAFVRRMFAYGVRPVAERYAAPMLANPTRAITDPV
jgi:hypothetical protein